MTKRALNTDIIEDINKGNNIYLVPDKDVNQAGIKACAEWKKIFSRARVLPIINAKDLGDMQILSRQGESSLCTGMVEVCIKVR